MLSHPQLKCLRTALGEPAIKCAGYRADCILEESKTLEEGSMSSGEDERTHEDVGMAIDVFSEGMRNDISSCEKGRGVIRREEGTVYKNERVGGVRACDTDNAWNRNEAKRGVCWRFYPY